MVAGCAGGVGEGRVEELPDRVRGSTSGVLGQVPVGVDGDADRGVPEHLGHDRHRDTGGQHQRRGTVPEVVQPDPAQSRVLGELTEATSDSIRAQRVPVLAGEHQAVLGVGIAPPLTFGVALQLTFQQGTDCTIGERHAGSLESS